MYLFCRVVFVWHSANTLFAECTKKYTRQKVEHSANIEFPVVQLHYKMCVGDIFILYLTCNLISLNLGDILYGISLLELYKEEDSTIFQH